MSRAYARMTSMVIQLDSIAPAFSHFRDVSAPLVRGQAGSLGIFGAGNRESGYACAISFWETLESLEHSNGNPQVVEAMAGYASWMAGPFKVESYTVVSGSVPEAGPDNLGGVSLRMTSALTSPDRIADVLASYEARLSQASASSEACFGTLLLSPQIGSRALAFEFWSSRAAASAWDARAKLDDQRLFRAGSVEEPPVRDILEVFGHY